MNRLIVQRIVLAFIEAVPADHTACVVDRACLGIDSRCFAVPFTQRTLGALAFIDLHA